MPALTPSEVLREIAKGATSRVDDPTIEPRFAVGDKVAARNLNPPNHTRLPRYVRGKHGRIARIRGVFSFPDTNANQAGQHPQYVYSVLFDSAALWGPHGRQGDTLCLDLWDDYLDPVIVTP